MIVIDGSQGEGGGQVLRTALSLSIATGTPFRIFAIRAHRARPGLRRQHLTAVQAAKAVSGAAVEGACPDASEITFAPGKPRYGHHAFDIGTAGSTTLVAQTLIPALLAARSVMQITLQGGTHNPNSPPFDFLERSYLPLLRRMGADVKARLVRRGFYPAGGGRIELSIAPTHALAPLELCRRGRLLGRDAHAIVARLPSSIAHRELAVIRDSLGWPDDALHACEDEHSDGPGNVLVAAVEFARLTEVFTGFGQRGIPAEEVAGGVVNAVSEYLASDAAVGVHLADQLLVPLALAGGGRFTSLRPSQHTMTNISVIEMFLPVTVHVEQLRGNVWSIRVRQRE